jgi:hypothetical protein
MLDRIRRHARGILLVDHAPAVNHDHCVSTPAPNHLIPGGADRRRVDT